MSLVIWRFSDGRPGHDSQSRGLVEALSRRVAVQHCETGAAAGPVACGWWLGRRFPPGDALPEPDLLIGAGHATHLPMLAARRARGGRAIVLMRPSLPCGCFDLCLVPQHDRPCGGKVLPTRGVLNGLAAGGRHDPQEGMIIIGGPSRHVRWNTANIVDQVADLQRRRPKRRWLLTTSPRTPAALPGLLAQRLPRLDCRPFAQTSAQWLADRMAAAGEVWVTRDSVSMIYEALTCGARVGLLGTPVKARDRVNSGIDRLIEDGWVTAPGRSSMAAGPPQPLQEAARCADWIIREWLSEN